MRESLQDPSVGGGMMQSVDRPALSAKQADHVRSLVQRNLSHREYPPETCQHAAALDVADYLGRTLADAERIVRELCH